MKVRTSARTNERTNEQTKSDITKVFCVKNNEICGKSPKKICRNGDFRHISGIFSRKKNFSRKLDSAIFWALLIRVFVQQIRKNEWWNLEIMRKNRFFLHISGIFGRKKMFSKIGLSHILGIANTRFCAKNQENQMMKSRENAKKPVFPAFSAGKIWV